jgi:hypothetical protein
MIYCGETGTFSSGSHIYVSGTAGTVDVPFYWYLSHSQVYDLTKGNYSGLKSRYADSLTTARTINGTSFNGSANITTANWGTARNISIGGTSKSVNGSANVTWATSEIAAQSAIQLATARTI